MASEAAVGCLYSMDEARAACGPHWPRRPGQEKVDIRDAWPMLEVGPGWADVIVHAVAIAEVRHPGFELHQVKEKFGGLRFYASISSETEGLIEGLASGVCEACGRRGSMSATMTGGWYKTVCGKHRVDADGRQRYWPMYDHPVVW